MPINNTDVEPFALSEEKKKTVVNPGSLLNLELSTPD